MRIINPDDTESLEALEGELKYWAYNSLDCLQTSEIFERTSAQLDPFTSHIYSFELSSLCPALELALRGIKVDLERRDQLLSSLSGRKEKLSNILLEYGQALGEGQIKANSPTQLKRILYDHLNLPIQHKYDRQAKENKISTDRTALEKLAQHSLAANALVTCILSYRDVAKTMSVLQSGVDPDGRMRFSFNVGGTETGRWSSSKSSFGGGMNAQNITEELREIFIADPGYKLAYVDLEQAESWVVAYLSGDTAYLEACRSGDLHTAVTRLIWTAQQWSGNLANDRKLADAYFYRQFSYRDMAKRGGHASNYIGTPRTIGTALKVEQKVIEEFQAAYFKAFPKIRTWHKEVAQELQTRGALTTPFGRRRQFLGRSWDDATLREAVAHNPQSLIADYFNLGLLRVWCWGKVQLLAQVTDAMLFQYPEDQPNLVHEAKTLLSSPLPLIGGGELLIPADVAVGWNWSKVSEANPDGLKKVNPLSDLRVRTPSGRNSNPVTQASSEIELLGAGFS